MSDADEPEFELVTSARQLPTPPPLRKKQVVLSDWKGASGKPLGFLECELSAGDYGAMVEEGWTYKDRVRQNYDNKGEDIRFLAWTTRDPNNNRLWSTVESAKAQLEPLGRGTLLLLVNAANEVNSPKPASAEGNSEETQSDS